MTTPSLSNAGGGKDQGPIYVLSPGKDHPPASSDHWCSRQTKAPHKWLLGMCWFLAMAHIWFAPDGDRDGDLLDDPSFGAPQREERPVRLSPGLSHYDVVGGVARDADEEGEGDAAEFLQGVGGERKGATSDATGATRSSRDAEDASFETFETKSLKAKQRSYLREAADHAGEAEDDAGEEQTKEAASYDASKGSKDDDAASYDPSEDAENDDATSNYASNDAEDKDAPTAATAAAAEKEKETIFDDSEPVARSNETKATETLVEALQPITSKECCIPAFTNVKRNDVPCFGTCYNERACTDRLYPFTSAAEKAALPLAEPTEMGKRMLRRECKSPEKMTPAVEWCQTPHVEHANGTAARLVRGIPPAGCSQVGNAGGSGAFQHVLLFPAAKLAFCGIPKVGISQWEQFLRFTFGAKDYPSLPHYKLDRDFFQFDKLDPLAQRRIWEDEAWTWAAFVREPAERLLSAYLDKIRGKVGRVKWIDKSLTFERFVEHLSREGNATTCQKDMASLEGLGWCSDPHWRPQVYSCGMSERLDRFQFVGDLRHAAEHTRELLSHVGLWDSHGSRFINGGARLGRSPWCGVGSHPHNHTRHVGFNQKDEATNSSAARLTYEHSQGSAERMERYYTPELLRRVREELYADDHDLWRLVSGNGAKLSRGKELAPRLSKKCESYVLTRPLP